MNLRKHWMPVGSLYSKTVYRSITGELAIERDFEWLSELTAVEKQQWDAQCARFTNAAIGLGHIRKEDTKPTVTNGP